MKCGATILSKSIRVLRRASIFFIWCLFAISAAGSHIFAVADTPKKDTELKAAPLPPCIGYNVDNKRWGFTGQQVDSWIFCPKNYAFMGIRRPPGHCEGLTVSIEGNCCPLPAEDILTSEHQEVDAECPEGSVVTGVFNSSRGKKDYCTKEINGHYVAVKSPLRCTRINQERYSLGPEHRGVHWGLSPSVAFPWREEKRIRRDEVPLAIRYGISRRSIKHFEPEGCVGEPAGALLVAKKASFCKGTRWRQLLHKSDTSQTPQAVKMFSDCKRIEKIFSPHAECVE